MRPINAARRTEQSGQILLLPKPLFNSIWQSSRRVSKADMHEHGVSPQAIVHSLSAGDGFPMKWKLNVQPRLRSERWTATRNMRCLTSQDSRIRVGIAHGQATGTSMENCRSVVRFVRRDAGQTHVEVCVWCDRFWECTRVCFRISTTFKEESRVLCDRQSVAVRLQAAGQWRLTSHTHVHPSSAWEPRPLKYARRIPHRQWQRWDRFRRVGYWNPISPEGIGSGLRCKASTAWGFKKGSTQPCANLDTG
jgi:hypothetical protein